MDYLLVEKELEHEYKLKHIALVSVRAKCETLMQVLELISMAKEEKLSLEDLENIVSDWLCEADSILRNILAEEPLFKFVIGRIELIKRVRKAKELRARA